VNVETSARNQLSGTVESVSLGAVMAEVTVDVNGAKVVAAIIKATDVMIGIA
jgi:molybdopterin-binding protein